MNVKLQQLFSEDIWILDHNYSINHRQHTLQAWGRIQPIRVFCEVPDIDIAFL